jgi:TPR repeat protein
MKRYELDFYGFSNEDGDGCMAVFVEFPDIKGVGDTFEEAEADAYERLENHFRTIKDKEQGTMMTFEQGVAAYEAREFSQAYECFEEAAASNDNAMVNLAFMHMKGAGCERSTEKAQAWFEKAAEMNNMHALNSLGIFYEKGMTGTVDADLALEFYAKAADLGHVEAQAKTGMMLRQDGKHADAMRYLIAAAHNNNAQAQEQVTYVSNKELCVEENEAFRALEPARQVELVETMIETQLKPTLAIDEGGIELVNFIPGSTPQIWLHYLGACSGCHLGSTSTAQMILDKFETLIDKNVVIYLM